MSDSKSFVTPSGRQLRLEIPKPVDQHSVFVLAGHKTGSSLLRILVADICEAASLPQMSIPDAMFTEGVANDDWPEDIAALLELDGFVFNGFREFDQLGNTKKFWERKKIVLIRDPRDCVCSHYFSMKFSHNVPETGKAKDTLGQTRSSANAMPIDDFVQQRTRYMLENYNKILTLAGRDDVVLYRYEEVIFDKFSWVKSLCNDLTVVLSDEVIAQIAKKHDIRPQQESPHSHIRKVTPGDYKSKLSAQSISHVETICSPYFSGGYYQNALRQFQTEFANTQAELTEVKAKLVSTEAELSKMKTRVVSAARKTDYLCHLALSKLPFATPKFRKRFARGAIRRWDAGYGPQPK